MKRNMFLTLVVTLSQFFAATAYADAYRIRAGDTLRVEVIEDPSLNRTTLVSPDGRISVPMAGAVMAAGRSIETIQSDLADKLAVNFAARPNVYVGVERLAEPRTPRAATPAAAPPTIDIFVLGEVGNPGKLTIPQDSTVLQAFASMGGFNRFAAKGRVQLRRTNAAGTEVVYPLNYEAIEAGLSNDGMVLLYPGDVIVVPQRTLFE